MDSRASGTSENDVKFDGHVDARTRPNRNRELVIHGGCSLKMTDGRTDGRSVRPRSPKTVLGSLRRLFIKFALFVRPSRPSSSPFLPLTHHHDRCSPHPRKLLLHTIVECLTHTYTHVYICNMYFIRKFTYILHTHACIIHMIHLLQER